MDSPRLVQSNLRPRGKSEKFYSYEELKKMYEDMRRKKQYHLLKQIHMLMPKVLRKN